MGRASQPIISFTAPGDTEDWTVVLDYKLHAIHIYRLLGHHFNWPGHSVANLQFSVSISDRFIYKPSTLWWWNPRYFRVSLGGFPSFLEMIFLRSRGEGGGWLPSLRQTGLSSKIQPSGGETGETSQTPQVRPGRWAGVNRNRFYKQLDIVQWRMSSHAQTWP